MQFIENNFLIFVLFFSHYRATATFTAPAGVTCNDFTFNT